MLLYRKENSALDCFCRYDVYLSHLYISRRNKSKKENIAISSSQLTPHHVQEF